ncbi:MAG TPA: neutral zinc metallopeptidase [Solirubrobacteraceae bacterium]
MRWRRGTGSPDVIDQRGGRVSGPVALGGGGGIVGLIITLIVVLSSGGGGGGSGFGGPIPADQDPDRDLKDFSSYVFTDAQRFWEDALGDGYRRAQMVLYSDAVNTGCGSASSAVGPFYCPADQRVYLDLSFYRQMARRLRAPGDFAWAYVIAHEVAHHVQQERGTLRSGGDNEASVRVELQADCYAGVWAHTVFQAGDLEPGDIDEAFTATEAVGDDRLQREATGSVDPDSFTHGSSEQRRRAFTTGYESGRPEVCETSG